MRFIMSIFMIWPFSLFLIHKIGILKEILLDEKQPIAARYKALHELRYIPSKQVIEIIGKAMHSVSDLLSHEAAYCLGQIGDENAIEMLSSVVRNESRAVIVRHEAAEAIGAIGKAQPLAIEVLTECQNSTYPALQETCMLALQRINFLADHNLTNDEVQERAPFILIDPAPALNTSDIEELKAVYLDNSKPLFDRYRALFALRNLASDEAVEIISEGLTKSDSALHRHQIAFILGELGKNISADALLAKAKDTEDHQIVRHESIQALGCMGAYLEQIKELFFNDTDPVISQTAEVAMTTYKNGKSYLHRSKKLLPEVHFEEFFMRLFK